MDKFIVTVIIKSAGVAILSPSMSLAFKYSKGQPKHVWQSFKYNIIFPIIPSTEIWEISFNTELLEPENLYYDSISPSEKLHWELSKSLKSLLG